MNTLSPALQQYVSTNAPALVDATVNYAELLRGDFASIDMYDNRGRTATISPHQFTSDVLTRASALTNMGLNSGDRVVLLAVNTEYYLATVLAVLAIGAIPCAVAPPTQPTQPNSSGVLHLRAAIETVSPAMVITQPRCTEALPGGAGRVVTFDQLNDASLLPLAELPIPTATDIHHIQLTSGSTSAPKAVVLSHQNVAHNIAAICCATGAIRGVDRAFNWLPLYHDMGFIQVLCALTHSIPLAMMSPLSFLRDPLSWLRHMSTHRATQTAGPPFAFRAAADALNRVAPSNSEQAIDLAMLQCAYVGAEAIPYSTLEYFTNTFRQYGLRSDTLVPCYGMAESVLATTLAVKPSIHEPTNFGRVRLSKSDQTGLEHVSCGPALDGIAIRILDADGDEVTDGVIGDIYLSGPSIMMGYLRTEGEIANPENGWHDTGDRGFLDNGELFVVGRRKELVIVRGRNFPPYDIERVIDNLACIGPGRSLVFSIPDAGRGQEGVAAMVGIDQNSNDVDHIRDEIAAAVRAAFGFSLDEISLLPAELIPRTTSGKLQRLKARELFLRGNFSACSATR